MRQPTIKFYERRNCMTTTYRRKPNWVEVICIRHKITPVQVEELYVSALKQNKLYFIIENIEYGRYW